MQKRLTVLSRLPRSHPRWRAKKEVRDPATFYAPHVELMLNTRLPVNGSQVTLFFFLSCFFCCIFYLEQLMKAEEKGSGAVSWSVYGAYIKAAGGPVVFIINIFFFLSTTGCIAFCNWWLSHWIRQGSGVSSERILLHDKRRLSLVFIWLPKEK